jgi:hypothetical protein
MRACECKICRMLSGKSRELSYCLVGVAGGAMSSFGPSVFPDAPHWIWPTLFFACTGLLLSGLLLLLIDFLPNKPDGRPVVSVLATIIFSFAVATLIGWILWPKATVISTAISDKPVPDSVLRHQSGEITELSNFLEKDESELWAAFDLYPMLEKNIGIQNIRIRDRLSGHPEAFSYNNFTEGPGNALMALAVAGKYHTTPSGVSFDEGSHDALYLVLTQKYVDAVKFIERFQKSNVMPSSLILSLSDFEKLIGKNAESIIDIINSRMNESDDYILEYNNVNSKYYKVIHNDFAEKFIPLRPEAEKVVLEIRKYWHID